MSDGLNTTRQVERPHWACRLWSGVLLYRLAVGGALPRALVGGWPNRVVAGLLLVVGGEQKGVDHTARRVSPLQRTFEPAMRVVALTPRRLPSRALARLLRPGRTRLIGDAGRLDLLAGHEPSKVLRATPRFVTTRVRDQGPARPGGTDSR